MTTTRMAWRPARECLGAADRTVRQTLAGLDISNFVDGRKTGKSHLKLRRACGCSVTITSTPSDHRAVKNVVSDVRRINVAHDNGMAVCQQ